MCYISLGKTKTSFPVYNALIFLPSPHALHKFWQNKEEVPAGNGAARSWRGKLIIEADLKINPQKKITKNKPL